MAWSAHNNIRDAAKWLYRKIELIEEKDRRIRSAKPHNYYRGAIFDAELGMDNIGGERNKTRPVLIISSNRLNKGDVVVVIPLSTKFRNDSNNNALYKNHYVLHQSKYTFLDCDSALKIENIRAIDTIRLRTYRGSLDLTDLLNLKNRILSTFGY